MCVCGTNLTLSSKQYLRLTAQPNLLCSDVLFVFKYCRYHAILSQIICMKLINWVQVQLEWPVRYNKFKKKFGQFVTELWNLDHKLYHAPLFSGLFKTLLSLKNVLPQVWKWKPTA